MGLGLVPSYRTVHKNWHMIIKKNCLRAYNFFSTPRYALYIEWDRARNISLSLSSSSSSPPPPDRLPPHSRRLVRRAPKGERFNLFGRKSRTDIVVVSDVLAVSSMIHPRSLSEFPILRKLLRLVALILPCISKYCVKKDTCVNGVLLRSCHHVAIPFNFVITCSLRHLLHASYRVTRHLFRNDVAYR
jgi:hypothetical protein